jgi:predicted nucleotide-binding protein
MATVSVFVGSSSEALPYARAVRAALEEESGTRNRHNGLTIDVTLWNEDFFLPTSTFIETLVNGLPRFDFAVFVLAPDDLIGRRDVSAMGPRDNVIFELGMFMGYLGRTRTFAIVHENATATPSDLAGVTTDRFRSRVDNNGRENHRAAVGAACDRITKIIHELGVSERKAGQRIAEMTQRQDAMESQVNVLRLLAKGLITSPEKDHMRGLASPSPFLVWYHPDMMTELKHLDALRYVLPCEGKGLNHLREFEGKAYQFDLKHFVYITESGREYLRLLEQLSNGD